MRAKTISQLSRYLPKTDAVAGLYSCDMDLGVATDQAKSIMHYAFCHKNMQFGWDFAKALAAAPEIPFPAFLHKGDLFVWRAYKYLQGYKDSVIEQALALTTEVSKPEIHNLKSMLVAKGEDKIENIAADLAMDSQVITAYEKLFYNVMDRKADHMYLATHVYPESRMVEAMKDYLEKTGLPTLLLRAGYNYGKDIVLYLMGIGEHPFSEFDASTGARELDGRFMRDGILYAAAGFQNTDGATPLKNARLSLQAGKMGHGDTQEDTNILDMGDAYSEELLAISRRRAESLAQHYANTPVLDIPST